MRVLVFVFPLAVALVAWKWCHDLATATLWAGQLEELTRTIDDVAPAVDTESTPRRRAGASKWLQKLPTAALATIIAGVGRWLERRQRRKQQSRR